MRNNSQKLFWSVVVFGIVWNIYGVYQFLGSVLATTESLEAMGLTTEQAALMTSYPVWMTAAFALGVFGGLIGSLLLAIKSKWAKQVFLGSLLGYIVLYIGDITEGVFAALGTSQVVILTMVVLIALGLWWYARRCEQGMLR